MAAAAVVPVTVRVLHGHVLDVLASLPEKSVHCVVTSPPYWSLRAYGTSPQVWGDGWSGELGSEPTLDAFVSHLVEVFAAVKRVMRDDATLWVNLGDSYNSVASNQNGAGLDGKTRGGNGEMGRATAADPSLKPGDLCLAPARFALAMQAAGWTLRSEITLCKTAPMPESVQGARWEKCRVKVAEAGQPRRREETESKARGGHPEHHHRDVPKLDYPEQRTEWADCPGCPRCAAQGGYVQRWGSGRPTSATEKLFLFSKAGQRYFYDIDAVRVRFADERLGASGAQSLPYSEGAGRNDTLGGEGRRGLGVAPPNAGRNLWNYVMWAPEPQGSFTTTTRVPVSADEAGRGTVRIPSPDCPVHARPQAATAGRGERSASPSNRTPGTGSHRALGLFDGHPSTPPPSSTDAPYSAETAPASPAATAHSTPGYRTAPALATSSVDTPSAGTAPRTGDRSGVPAPVGPHPGTNGSSTGLDGTGAHSRPETSSRTAGTSPDAGAPPAGAPSTDAPPSNVGSSTGAPDPGESPSAGSPARTPGSETSVCTCSYYKDTITESSHYAAFPRWLPRLAIRAGTSERGVCPHCGAPWLRVVERHDHGLTASAATVYDGQRPDGWHHQRRVTATAAYGKPGSADLPPHTAVTRGWRPSCRCPSAEPSPATVLDPFAGSGTTLLEANALGRHGWGIELQERYIRIAHQRLARQPLSLFAHEGAAALGGEAAGD